MLFGALGRLRVGHLTGLRSGWSEGFLRTMELFCSADCRTCVVTVDATFVLVVASFCISSSTRFKNV